MSDESTAAADRALEEELAASGARDPREFCRERLRALKQSNTDGYERSVEYYRDVLIPDVAAGSRQPLDAWTEYGRLLADSLAPGRTVTIDESGRAHPYERPLRDRLILHLPDGQGGRAILVGLPAALSAAQRATYDVLVSGKQRARD